MLVPSAVQEADRLYKDHIYVSLGLHQLWKEREEFIKEDIGLGGSGILGFGVENMVVDEDEEEGEVEVARDAIMKEFREKEREFRKEEGAAEKERDWKKAKKIQEKRMAWKRLERVELIYVRFSFLSPFVISFSFFLGHQRAYLLVFKRNT